MDSDSYSYTTVLELRMKKECLLKNAQEVLSGPFSTAYFDFSSTGLVVKARDTTSGGAYAAVLQLSPEAFDHYYYCDEEHFSVDLHLATLVDIFSCANSDDDIITMKYQCEDGLSFPISVSPPGSHVVTCFRLDIELDAKDETGGRFDSECPESMYQAIVRMPSADFMDFCNKLSWDTAGDKKAVVRITVGEDNVGFFTDKSSAIVRLRQTQNGDKPNESTCVETEKKISLTFDLRCLKNFSKASTLSDQVTIKLSSDLPAVFEYKIAEMGYIRYHVMPADKQAEAQGKKRKIRCRTDD